MWIERLAKRLFNPRMADFRHGGNHNVENFSTCRPEDVNRRVRASPSARRNAAPAADASRREHR